MKVLRARKAPAQQLPRISIVTPSFNQARFLEETLLSVLSQDYPGLEYVVLDGGSTDGSGEIVREYSGQLAYWRSAKDDGQASAIYEGFQRSTGDLLGWVNSDDVLLPGCLRKVGEWALSRPDSVGVIGDTVVIDEKGEVAVGRRLRLPVVNRAPKITLRRLLVLGCGFHQPGSFWRRKPFFESGGFDRSLRFSFDYDMYLRLARHGDFDTIHSFLACFRVHPESKTRNQQAVRIKEDRLLHERHGLGAIPSWQRALCKVLQGGGARAMALAFRVAVAGRLVNPPSFAEGRLGRGSIR